MEIDQTVDDSSSHQDEYRYKPYPQRNSYNQQRNRTFIFDSRKRDSRKTTYNYYGENLWNQALVEKSNYHNSKPSYNYTDEYKYLENADEQHNTNQERKDSKNLPGSKVVIKFDTTRKKSLRDMFGN